MNINTQLPKSGFMSQLRQSGVDELDYSSFDPKETFTRDNAVLLSSAAALSYASPEFQQEYFSKQASIEEFHFLDSKNNTEGPDTGTQVSVVETGEALIVATRGTPLELSDDPDTNLQLVDVVNDLNAIPTKNYDESAYVHSGFKNAADGIWEQLQPHLAEAKAEGKDIHLAGHSLGAAISTHIASRMALEMKTLPTSLHLVGGPATGWAGQKEHLQEIGMEDRTIRYVHNTDPVVGAVPLGAHVGEQVYFDSDGQAELGDGYRIGDRLEGFKDAILSGNWNPLSAHLPVTYHKLIADPKNGAVLDKLAAQVSQKK